MAKDLAPAIAGDAAALADQDSSTAGLIAYYRAHRK
jgi:glucose-6-phosphate isomerase